VKDAVVIDGPIVHALADHRDRFNALVAEARRTHSDFDVAVLDDAISGPLRSTAEAAERSLPGSSGRVVAALFPLVVDLVAQRRLGVGGTHGSLLHALPSMAVAITDDPRVLVGSLANAVIQLGRYDVASDEWLSRVARVGATSDVGTTLRAGQVAAWALGASHLRHGALEVAATLDDDELAAALGSEVPLPRAETVERLRADRWWRPDRPLERASFARRVGGFRGFGGPFLSPPIVGARDGAIVVRSGGDAWVVHADAFGATLTRTSADEVSTTAAPAGVVPAGIHPTSVAAVADVAAIAVATSYEVLVVEVSA
jgi:hypothetical protein